MKMTWKIRTYLKNWCDFRNEDNLKHKDNAMNEDNFKSAVFISEDLHITRIHDTLDVFRFVVFLIWIDDVSTFVQLGHRCGLKQNTRFDLGTSHHRQKLFSSWTLFLDF